MKKTARSNYADIFSAFKMFFKQVEIDKQLAHNSSSIISKFDIDYSLNSLFPSVLTRVHLMYPRSGITVPFLEPVNNCPEAFCFDFKKIDSETYTFFDFGPLNGEKNKMLFWDIKNRSINFCSLIISPDGIIFFLISPAFESLITQHINDSSGYSALLNIPYLFNEIIKNENFSVVRKKLEDFLKANNTCTLAHIFNYVRDNPSFIEELPSIISDINNYSDIFSFYRKKFLDNFKNVKNSFIYKANISKTNNFYIKYLIGEEEGGNLKLEMDYRYNLSSNASELAKFPAKIIFTKKGIIPWYLPVEFYSKGNIANISFVTHNVSVKGLGSVITDSQDLSKIDLGINIKKLISSFNKFLKLNDIVSSSSEKQKTFDMLKLNEQFLRSSLDKLSNLLSTLYVNEIVLNNF